MPQAQVNRARVIATRCLRACYRPLGIVAGNHHFTDYWARDGYFAAFGALALGDVDVVTKMTDLFFSHQREDGLIPYRIMRGPVTLSKYLGKPTYFSIPKPTYRLRGFGPEVLDGTTLTVLFAALTNQHKYLPKIKQSLQYLESREKHGLLWDGPMSEWNDVVYKWGNLLYSNVLYWYMYDQLALWFSSHDSTWATQLREKRDEIASSLRDRLWNGKYFSDWHDYKRQDYLYPFGNSLAVIWGLTTQEETISILQETEKLRVAFTLETNAPRYPWWRIDVLQRILGMADYQNQGILWWQPVTAHAMALKKSGDVSLATSHLGTVANKIVQDQIIHESYERDGTPVERWLYRSERPFAWGSGMLVWALGYNTEHDEQ